MSAEDLLKLTLAEALERLVAGRAPSTDADPWVDAAESPVGRARVLQAAQRGELVASRIGRRVLVRRSALDRWLEAQRIEPRRPASQKAQPASGVAHLLESHGYRRAGGAS